MYNLRKEIVLNMYRSLSHSNDHTLENLFIYQTEDEFYESCMNID